MTRENKKVSIVYILTGIVLLLIIYLGLFVYRTFNSLENKHSDIQPETATSCTFNMTTNEFNDIENNPDMCGNLNKINLTDVSLNGKKLDVSIYYSTNTIDDLGIYINEALVITDNVPKIHKFSILDNKLFITDISNNEASFSVFDENGINIYNLKDALNSLQLADPAFTANVNPVLSVANIDKNSFKFDNGSITFNSTLGSCVNKISGSSYIITYKNNTFANPEFVANVTC